LKVNSTKKKLKDKLPRL